MVCQRRPKKSPRKGIRRSLRLELQYSRPKLDVTFQLSALKVLHPIDDNSITTPEVSKMKSSPVMNSSFLADDLLNTQSVLSEVMSLQSMAENLTTPEMSKTESPTRNLETPDVLSEINSFLITNKNTQSTVENSTRASEALKVKSPVRDPSLANFDFNSPELFKIGSSSQDYLNVDMLIDENAQPYQRSLGSKSINCPVKSAEDGATKEKKASELTTVDIPLTRKTIKKRKSLNTHQRKTIKKEFRNAAESFIQNFGAKTSTIPVSHQVDRPKKLKHRNYTVGNGCTNAVVNSMNEQCTNWTVDELCSQFQMFEFFPKPRYFLKDAKLSLDDCLMSRSSNVLTQKYTELNEFKSRGFLPPPSFIPFICEAGMNCNNYPFGNPLSYTGSQNVDDNLEIHKILKSISHVPSKVPSYEPYEENWYEGFDVWSK